MTDLAVNEADMQSLSAALGTALLELTALQHSLHHMNLDPVGAPPLLDEQTTYTRTRYDDVTDLGKNLNDRIDDVERVGPTLQRTDHQLSDNAPQTR
ncbi:hypothetical protein [Streptomyces sp. NPDC008317]|uniref:hypothetical protein n=1 Tax=Streptomyces sp. NPDC008317 TaxID=3364827 RepID=UPI0036E52DED